jgi:hypothetical protein
MVEDEMLDVQFSSSFFVFHPWLREQTPEDCANLFAGAVRRSYNPLPECQPVAILLQYEAQVRGLQQIPSQSFG